MDAKFIREEDGIVTVEITDGLGTYYRSVGKNQYKKTDKCKPS